MVDEGGQGVESGLVGVVAADVRPFAEQGAVEAFGLAVGLGPEWPGDLVPGTDLPERVSERPGPGVVLGVVGQDPLDPHAVAGEEGRGVKQEPSTGRTPLVIERSDVGDPAHVVDRDVQVVVAAMRPWRAGYPAAEPVTTAVGDPAELLDVDVEQLTRPLARERLRAGGRRAGGYRTV